LGGHVDQPECTSYILYIDNLGLYDKLYVSKASIKPAPIPFFSASDVREKKKKGRKRREWQSKEKEESQGSSSEGDADQASLNDGQTGQRFGKSMESLE